MKCAHLAATVAWIPCVLPASAGTLYGISNGFGTAANNQVYELNAATGAISNAVQVTFAGATVTNSLALVAHPQTGVLWGVIQTMPGGRRLVTINPATGVASAVGSLSNQIAALSFKPDGSLLAVSGDGGTPAETLYSVNTATAALTQLFTLGNGDNGEAIALYPDGSLYHSSGDATAVFERVNLTTAEITPLGNGSSEAFALAWSAGLNQMFLSDSASGLYTVNLANGTRTLVGAIPSLDRNRGLAFVEGTPSNSFCFGDGTGTTCPCTNSGAAGNGCANSSFAAGARIASFGSAGASVGTDTLVLVATNVPGPGLFFQGDAVVAGGSGTPFDDGLMCAGGSIVRLGVVFPAGGTVMHPSGSTPNQIHVAGATVAGDVRNYQCWYRDSTLGFCTSANSNLTQAIALTWGT